MVLATLFLFGLLDSCIKRVVCFQAGLLWQVSMLVRDLFFQGAEDAVVAFFAEGFAVFKEYWFMDGQGEFVAGDKP